MASPSYPYPTIEKDGFQLALVEQGDMRILTTSLATDDERYAAKPGDTVKLIFEYREPMKALGSGQEFGAEHMWVQIVDYGDGCLIGRLDCSPQYTNLLKADDTVAFHPRHIIAFFADKKNG